MERAFPLFLFADHGWKLDHLIITHYPSWSRQRFGKKQATWKGKEKAHPKMEVDDDNKSEDDECNYIDDDIDNTNTGDPTSELDDGGEASTSMGSGCKRQNSAGGITTPLKKHKFYDPDNDLDLLYISPPTTQEFSSFSLSQDPTSVPSTTATIDILPHALPAPEDIMEDISLSDIAPIATEDILPINLETIETGPAVRDVSPPVSPPVSQDVPMTNAILDPL